VLGELVSKLGRDEIVVVVTQRTDGSRKATAIWAVVVDGVPFVRSVKANEGIWYKQAISRPGWFAMGDGSAVERNPDRAFDQRLMPVAFRAVPPSDPIQSAITEAFLSKYAAHADDAAAITRPDAVACTLRVEPQ